MIGFLLKKNFFDLWDNIFKIALINGGFIVSLSFPVFIPRLFAPFSYTGMALMLIGFLWCFVYLSAAAMSLKALSDYSTFGFADFFTNLKTFWPTGLFLGSIVFFGYIIFVMVIPFYLSMNSMLGLLLAVLIFWTMVVTLLSLQFFFAEPEWQHRFLKRPKNVSCFFSTTPCSVFSPFFTTCLRLFSPALWRFSFRGPRVFCFFLTKDCAYGS